VVLLSSSSLWAQTEAGSKAPAAKAKRSGEVPNDKNGIKGISPFWEAVKAGDNAYLARDFDGALTHYQDAVTKDPQNAIGHLRMGEVQLKQDKLKETEQSLVAAVRFAGEAWRVRAKAFYLLAVLRERQSVLGPTVESWEAYRKLGEQHPEAKIYAETPPERIRRAKEADQLQKDYASVKERIAKRLAEAEEKAKKSAK
jgi:tetratricopeptide (TPR) repeat protein